MKRAIVVLILAIYLASFASPGYGEDNLNRVRAVESLFILDILEIIFPHPSFYGPDLRDQLSEAFLDRIRLKVGTMLRHDELNKGRLWIHKELWRESYKRKGYGELIKQVKIVRYEDISEIRNGFNAETDFAVLSREELFKLATEGEGNLREGIILAPLVISPEFIDQILISLVLMRELKELLARGEFNSIVKTDEFVILKSLLESLLGIRQGLKVEDVLNMIPHPGVSFGERVITIIQNVMPIREEDLQERIRPVQAVIQSV